MQTEAQAKAAAKYEQKKGIIAKTYKLNKDVVDDFKKACDRAGVSQAAKITELMQDFICQQEK